MPPWMRSRSTWSASGAADHASGGGIRSLNVALRQLLDLYVCLRPVRYFRGVPSRSSARRRWTWSSSARTPRDIYSGIEYASGSAEAQKLIAFLQNELGVKRSASRRPPASASSPCPAKARSA